MSEPISNMPRDEKQNEPIRRSYADGGTRYHNEPLVAAGIRVVTVSDAIKAITKPQQPLPDPSMYIPGTRLKHGMTVFLFGKMGTWKTTWAAQWPRPIFLSVGSEGGDDALIMLPVVLGIQPPPVIDISSPYDMQAAVNKIITNYKKWGICTLVIDHVTAYMDLWVTNRVLEKQGGKSREKDYMEIRDWGVLKLHMQQLAVLLHKTELNVIWIAWETERKDKEGDTVGIAPNLAGGTKDSLPGLCKLVLHAHKELRPDPNVSGRSMVRPVYYTSPSWSTDEVRHKYASALAEGKLVDPELGDYPTFRALYNRVGDLIYTGQ